MIDQQTKYLVVGPTGEILDDALDLSGYGFELTATGLLPTMEPTFKQWQSCGRELYLEHKRTEKRTLQIQFAIGDWLNYGEGHYGETYAQALDETEYTYGTLRNFKYVSEHVQMSSRNDNLSYKHHAAVAPLDTPKQREWLSKAQAEGMSADALYEKVRVAGGREPRYLICENCQHKNYY